MKLYTTDLIDPLIGVHYAYHKSLKDITLSHTHDFYEIFLVTRGKSVHIINDKKEILNKGDLVFIRASDTHSYEMLKEENCELINLAFPEDTLTQLLDYFGAGFNKERLLQPQYPLIIKVPPIETDILLARFEGLNTIPRKFKQRINTEFKILIAELFSRYFSIRSNDSKEDIPAWLSKLTDEMEKKENFIIGIERMYQLSERSPEHLGRMFKKYYGETPTIFIKRLRLNYAANLLANSDETIAAIALDTGFDNLSHFYHLFKKHFDVSPREFRQKHLKMIIPF